MSSRARLVNRSEPSRWLSGSVKGGTLAAAKLRFKLAYNPQVSSVQFALCAGDTHSGLGNTFSVCNVLSLSLSLVT